MTQKVSEVPQNSGVPTPEFRDLSQTSDTGPRTLGPVGMPVLLDDKQENKNQPHQKAGILFIIHHVSMASQINI